ncbi:hypothetical protein [Arthrobacter sp. GMC3]|nr:hypothetical protein [Arthrobacter sp. GMC3]
MSAGGFTSYPLTKRQWKQHALDQALTDHQHEGGEDHATSLDQALDD